MELFLMTLTTGIMVGGIYALIALGWVLIYKCSGVLNLAMGELTLIGAYVSLSFYSMGIPFLLSLLFSLIIGFILGVLTERIFLDRLIGEPILSVIMVTVGLSFFFKGIVELIWGTDTRVFTPAVFPLEHPHWASDHRPGVPVELCCGHCSSCYLCRIFSIHPLGPCHAGHGR